MGYRPQGNPTSPVRCPKPGHGFGFAYNDDAKDCLSKRTLESLSSDSKIRLLFWPQRVPELVFPFCVYEAKSAMGGTIGFSENQAAVGAATAAALLSELVSLSGVTSSSCPPVFLLASQGSAWTIHACISKTIDDTQHYHIHPFTTILDMHNPMQLFCFHVIISRIRDHALFTIKPWIKEQLGRIVLQNNDCLFLARRSTTHCKLSLRLRERPVSWLPYILSSVTNSSPAQQRLLLTKLDPQDA